MKQIIHDKNSTAHIAKINNNSIVGVINKKTGEKGYIAKGHIGGDCRVFTKKEFLFGHYVDAYPLPHLRDVAALLLCSDEFDLWLF